MLEIFIAEKSKSCWTLTGWSDMLLKCGFLVKGLCFGENSFSVCITELLVTKGSLSVALRFDSPVVAEAKECCCNGSERFKFFGLLSLASLELPPTILKEAVEVECRSF